MSSEEILVIGRVAERLFVCFCGGLSIMAGYRLFRLGVVDPQSGELSGKGFKVNLQRCGPGVFFALFGTIILSLCLYQSLHLYEKPSNDPTRPDLGSAVYYLGSGGTVTPFEICNSITTLQRMGETNSDGSLVIQPQRLERVRTAVDILSGIKQKLIEQRFSAAELNLYKTNKMSMDQQDSALSRAQRQRLDELSRWYDATLN
jgi:hypothetical protein